jgi:hypothetical protein
LANLNKTKLIQPWWVKNVGFIIGFSNLDSKFSRYEDLRFVYIENSKLNSKMIIYKYFNPNPLRIMPFGNKNRQAVIIQICAKCHFYRHLMKMKKQKNIHFHQICHLAQI